MGKIRYMQDVRDFFKRNIVVDVNSLKKFIQQKKGNEKYIHLLITNLIKKGEIKRITKGYYSIYDDPILSVFCFKPSYIGLQSALSIHDLWEQETIPMVITTRKVRQGIRDVNGSNIMIRRISKKYFFGISYEKEGDFYAPVSSIEKTFIDMIYFKQKIGKEVLNDFKKKMDRKKLNDLIKRYPNNLRKRILGLLPGQK